MTKPHASNPRAVREARQRQAVMARAEQQAARRQLKPQGGGGPSSSKPDDSMFAVRAGLGYQDGLEAVRGRLHDQLIEAYPVRLGPVQWLHYTTTDKPQLRGVLSRVGMAEAGLVEWAILHPGCLLVLAMVEVPRP